MRLVERYDYVNEGSAILYEVGRYELAEGGKTFKQRRPDGKGGWIPNLDGVRRVLYRLPEVLQAIVATEWIYLVEGEKDVETLRKFKKVATTCQGGAENWNETYTETLRGARVILIGDADMAGAKRALRIASALYNVVAELRIYSPQPGAGNDVSELLEGCKTKQEAKDRLSKGLRRFELREPPDPSVSPLDIRVMSVRELMATPDPKEEDKLWGPALMRGNRMIVAAYNGHGKSTFSMWLIASIVGAKEFLGWKGQGDCRALVLDVEQGRWTLKNRFSEAGLDAWPDRIDLVHAPDGLSLDCDAGQCKELEDIFKRGKYDVVLADPLYKLHRTTVNDERNAVDLMRKFDAWRGQYGFALIMPMHCRKPQGGVNFDLADISGVAALGQGAEVIIGLDRKSSGYTHLHWWKDRDGYTDCLMERWGLSFKREQGFRRDPRDLEDVEVVRRERVRKLLRTTPGLLRSDIAIEIGASDKVAVRVMESLGCRNDGAKYKKDQRWYLPEELFDSGDLARWKEE